MIKNFNDYTLLLESENSFKPLEKINLLDLDNNQNQKISSISSEEGFNMDSFLDKKATIDMIVEAPGFKSGDLYDAMRSWLFKYYEDPKKSEGRWEKSINQGKIKGIFTANVLEAPGLLGSSTYYLRVEYNIDFYFKDDKFRVVYSNIYVDPTINSQSLPGDLIGGKPPYLTGSLSDDDKIQFVKPLLAVENKREQISQIFIKKGDTGDIVTAIQRILGAPDTGKYDDETFDAVKKFQVINGIKPLKGQPSIEGICDNETLLGIYKTRENTGVNDEFSLPNDNSQRGSWSYIQIANKLGIDPNLSLRKIPSRKSQALVNLYKASFNNGSALFISIKEQMKNIKPGQTGGPEFDF